MAANLPERYRMIEVLGSGAMGVVYRAEQVALGREVAVKCLAQDAGRDKDTLTRFRREALAMSRVVHPGLVKVYEVASAGEEPFIAMELVAGRTLHAEMGADPWGVRRRADVLFLAIAEAVAALHIAGLVHRDIKPTNVMLRADGRPVVMDLGLAKDTGSNATQLTGVDSVVGTPMFLPPEALAGAETSMQADVWALGVLYFWLHTGERPFDGLTLQDIYESICSRPMSELLARCEHLPPGRQAILTQMLERDPGARLATAGAVVRAFTAAPRRVPERVLIATSPPAARPRGYFGAVLAALAALACALIAARTRAPRSSPPSASPTPSAWPSVAPHVESRPLVTLWRSLAPVIDQLRVGGPAAKARAKELTAAGPIALGSSPRSWVFWWELGNWLEQPSNTWAPANASRPGMEASILDQHGTVFSLTWHARAVCPSAATIALSTVELAPGQPAGWLLLGLCLEAEGREDLALPAYRVGLRLMGDTPLDSGASILVWRALARALVRVRSDDLERQWARLGCAPRGPWRAWRGLQLACQGAEHDRAVSILHKMFNTEGQGVDVRAAYGWDLEAHDAAPEQVAAVMFQPPWNQESTLRAACWQHWLGRGRVDLAKPYGSCAWAADLPGVKPRPPPVGAVKDYCGAVTEEMILALQLEARELGLARTFGEACQRDGIITPAAWASDQLRVGLPASRLPELAALIRNGQLPWAELDTLAGNLAAPVHEPWFEDALRAAVSRDGTGVCARVALALWQSRSGRHTEALDELAPVWGHPHAAAEHADAILEVLARPLWEQLVGRPVSPAVLSRLPARDRPPVASPPEIAPLWDALSCGDARAAVTAARALVDRNPAHPVRVLALAYAGAASGNQALAEARAGARDSAMDLWVLDEIARLAPRK